MFHGLVLVGSVVAVYCAMTGPCAFASDRDGQKQDGKDKAPPAKEASASLTGCVDEQEGSYILLNDRTMSPIANLEADGFPKEGFAKHLGHKVTVRGISNAQGALPVFKVRTIETLSDTCAPSGGDKWQLVR
jgi:hypothetical protein